MSSSISPTGANLVDLNEASDEQVRALHRSLSMLDDRQAQRLFFDIFPEVDTVWRGPSIMGGLMQPWQVLYAREKYARHLEFFRAGAKYRERCMLAANRVGKSFSCGGYELSCHLTGLYPKWWEGRRFDHPISSWAIGDTYETTRDILQLTLFGQIANTKEGRKGFDGRGMIPGYALGRNTWRSGVQDLADTVIVKHYDVHGVHDGNSFCQLKSSDQGRRSFQGTARHVVWLDEECPVDVYGECLIRTATVNGIVMLTFTPLRGLTEVVLSFLPADQRPDITA